MNALATDNKYETERYLSSHSIADNTLVLILAGGRGSRLHEMTDRRSKPPSISAVTGASSTSPSQIASIPICSKSA